MNSSRPVAIVEESVPVSERSMPRLTPAVNMQGLNNRLDEQRAFVCNALIEIGAQRERLQRVETAELAHAVQAVVAEASADLLRKFAEKRRSTVDRAAIVVVTLSVVVMACAAVVSAARW